MTRYWPRPADGLPPGGVPLHEALAAVGITEAPAPYVVARGADRQWTALLWEDLTARDVLLATHLDGMPLDARHGAPLRLVAPGHYRMLIEPTARLSERTLRRARAEG